MASSDPTANANTKSADSADTTLPPYKQAFLQTCLTSRILRFGTFTLKSGRTSPYFFNTALFHTAPLTLALCTAYAETLLAAQPALSFDILFGPAYKGIPLAYGTVLRLGQIAPDTHSHVSFCHDRKEAKDHGEGGMLVGASMKGKRVVIVDDVVTGGEAKRQAIELIRKEGGEVVGIVVALDRMEKLTRGVGGSEEDRSGGRGSAIGELKKEYGVPVLSCITLDDLVGGLRGVGMEGEAEACEEYRRVYRASD